MLIWRGLELAIFIPCGLQLATVSSRVGELVTNPSGVVVGPMFNQRNLIYSLTCSIVVLLFSVL